VGPDWGKPTSIEEIKGRVMFLDYFKRTEKIRGSRKRF